MENEIWKPVTTIVLKNGTICNFIGYEVSNYGRVRTYKQRYGKGPKGLLPNHSPLAGRKDRNGYIQFWLIDTSLKGRNFRAHTIVMQTFMGIPKEYQVICHHNDVKTDNHISNLRYDTSKENAKDRERNRSAKST